MNPSAAFFAGSDIVFSSAGRKSLEIHSDQLPRTCDPHQAISLPSDRSGTLSRSGSGMAGSIRGGLSSLLSSPAVPSSQLQRSSGSDQFLTSSFTSDPSSVDIAHSRSCQTLSSLSGTPKSRDRSPGPWAIPSALRMSIGMCSSPGVSSGTSIPNGHLSSSHPLNLANFPLTLREKASGSIPRGGVQFAAQYRQPYAGGMGPLYDTVVPSSSGERLGSLLLQAKPSKPTPLSAPFQRSVGFSLPGLMGASGSSLTPIASVNQLSDQGSICGSLSGRDTEGGVFDTLIHSSSFGSEPFMTPVTSLNTLVPDYSYCEDLKSMKVDVSQEPGSVRAHTATGRPSVQQSEQGAAKHGRGILTSWADVSGRGHRQDVSLLPAAQSRFCSEKDPGAALLPGRDGLAQQREFVLQLAETANGLHQQESVSKEALLIQAQKEHPIFYNALVKRAFEVAASAHSGQVRKNGMPVLSHCVETALILARIGAGSAVVAAGLLHDCLDDTPMTADQLEASFGAPIAQLVEGVSNLSNLSQRTRDSLGALCAAETDRLERDGRALSDEELDRLRMMILSMVDVRVVLIKLADRLHNLRTLSALPDDKQRRLASETLEVFAPLANRLGIWTWKAEIEDICFRTLWSREHEELNEAMEGTHGDKVVLRSIEKLDGELRASGVEAVDLHGRAKNMYSIFRKMKSKGKTLQEVFDRRGIRLIVRDVKSCYGALAAVRRAWKDELKDHFKDYVDNPKGNGYQSIHVVVNDDDGHPLEIQIRTEAMHEAAEFGVAAHWRYKESRPGVQSSQRIAIGEAATCPDEIDDEEEKASMQRVEWLRYILSWVAELTDTKVRLTSGCSPTSYGASSGCWNASPTSAVPVQGMCQFPEHAEDCCFRPDCVKSHRPAPRQPVPDSEPLIVLLVENTKLSVKRLKGCATRASFLRDYLSERGQLHLQQSATLLVNSELVPMSEERINIGDQLEVVIDQPLSPLVPSPGVPFSAGGLDEDELLFEADVAGEFAGLVPVIEDSFDTLLPAFATSHDCELAREFQRHKLAATFAAGNVRTFEHAHGQ